MSSASLHDHGRADRTRRAGFTLLELMISISILGIIVIGVFSSLTRQHRTSIVTESIVEVQNNVRAIASLLEREIRMGGYMVPDAVAVCGLDSTTGGDELFVSENEPIVPDDARASRRAPAPGATRPSTRRRPRPRRRSR
jgi:prepilin-type N-terminal cleavage/methylation domain-containing protein